MYTDPNKSRYDNIVAPRYLSVYNSLRYLCSYKWMFIEWFISCTCRWLKYKFQHLSTLSIYCWGSQPRGIPRKGRNFSISGEELYSQISRFTPVPLLNTGAYPKLEKIKQLQISH